MFTHFPFNKGKDNNEASIIPFLAINNHQRQVNKPGDNDDG